MKQNSLVSSWAIYITKFEVTSLLSLGLSPIPLTTTYIVKQIFFKWMLMLESATKQQGIAVAFKGGKNAE